MTTALGASRVWLAIGHGILNEVYWPSTGKPQVRDLGFIVGTPSKWHEVKRVNRYRISTPDLCMPSMITGAVAPVYLLTNDVSWIIAGFIFQGFFAGAVPLLAPSYLNERFPTEVRSTASGFCYGFGGAVGSFAPMSVSYLAIEQQMGFAVPLLLTTTIGSLSITLAALFGPETKGIVFTADLMTQPAPSRLLGAPDVACLSRSLTRERGACTDRGVTFKTASRRCQAVGGPDQRAPGHLR